MTVGEARGIAVAHARETAAALRPTGVDLVGVPDAACIDVWPPGGITVAARVWVRGVAVEQALTTLYERWTTDGYQILDDRRTGPARTLLAQRPDDEFWLRAAVNVRDELMITVSSPCLWPSDRGEPTSDKGGRRR